MNSVPTTRQELAERYSDGERAFGGAQLEGVDLSNLNLGGVILATANLKDANLEGTNLSKTNLIGCNFQGANLKGVNLSPSSMVEADLYQANLQEANLSGVQLRDSFLVMANFTRATFSGVGLKGANIGATNFTDTMLSLIDFSGAIYPSQPPFEKGLPNIVDLNTLQKTARAYALRTEMKKAHPEINFDEAMGPQGPLMDFLARCGLEQSVLSSFEDWSTESGSYSSVFISYSSKDEEFAKQLYERLVQSGVSAWFAPKDIRGGRKIYDQISQALDSTDKMLLVLSGNSMKSNWVNTELLKIRDRELQMGRQLLFPIRLTDFETVTKWSAFDPDTGHDLAREVRSYHIPDFSNWSNSDSFHDAVTSLLQDLQKEDYI